MNWKGVPVGAVFQGLGLPTTGGPTMSDLPAGFILEYGAQQSQQYRDAHSALVQSAIAHAAQNPVIVFLLPQGYVGPAP